MKRVALSFQITKFIDGNPVNKHTEERTNIDIDILKKNAILKMYVCDMCQVEVGDRSRHITRHILEHAKNHSIKTIVKDAQAEYDVDSNDPKNVKKKNKKAKKEERIKKIEKLPKRAKSFLSSDLGAFLDKAVQLGKKLMEIPEYEIVEKRLFDALKPGFPDLKIYFFGSRINGLSNPNSDLDVFLDVGKVYHTYKRNANESKKIKNVESLLRKNIEWRNFHSVKNARVPILKAFYVTDQFRIDCDISFSHGLGHLNTLLIKYIFELQPICHKLCLFLKQWIKVTSLNDLVSTYAYVLMAVYFFQTKNMLPSIKTLQDGINTPLEIGPWEGDFIEKSLNDLNIEKVDDTNKICLKYIKEFFKFYAEFNFENLIVCPYLGKPVEKAELHGVDLDSIPRYKNYYLMDPKENGFLTNKPVCVMDPLELNHNVTKGISMNCLQMMKQYWKITFDELSSRE
ncbi:terminal uridylyltransferase Tailor-like isoform X2 [Condylostylus longicornis]|uniref:terminal uridylyltransferase Tailor-like isoform X2 n=1 Tax=Condylostylus longicornis TaxID=2530218 RepID=UPI00244DDD18|nr:terminal uridylyltransferase Tailor-like isoform X2 [Condylostylus longicornis]